MGTTPVYFVGIKLRFSFTLYLKGMDSNFKIKFLFSVGKYCDTRGGVMPHEQLS